jgi:hypothetical protein
MKVLAILLACASCVSPSPTAGGAPDLGESTVVGAPAEPPSTPRSVPIEWTYDDDDHGSDACHAAAIADDGSVIIAGEVQRLAEGRNAWARRYAAGGAVAWTYELHTPSEGADAARGVIGRAAGGAVVAGEWYSGSPSAQNHFVMQLAGDSAPAWQVEGELAGADTYASVARAAGGELVVAGSFGSQAWVRGLDATDGTVEWEATQGTDAAARRVAVAASGDVLVGGTSGAGGWVSRYHAHDVVATMQLAGSVDDLADAGGRIAVIASGLLTVYSPAGDVIWRTPAESAATWRAVAARSDGALVVAGIVGDSLAVRIYDADGTQLWQGAVAGAVPEAVAANSAGDVVACGSRDGDVYAVKFPH